MSNRFPWAVFSANTLRPMLVDIMRAGGFSPSHKLSKEATITLLENVEKHGLEVALKGVGELTPSTRLNAGKRKHEEEDEANDVDNGESASRPVRKRGRAQKAPQANDNAIFETVSAPAATRSRGRNPDLGPGEGLLTRRQAAQARAEKVPVTRSSKAPPLAPRKTAPAAKKTQARGSKRVVSNANAKPTSTGKKFFDGVELVKRPQSQVGKGKGKERETREDEELDACGSDVDAEGENEVDDKMEVDETVSSSLENSNKENISLTEIANADTDVDAEGEEVPLPDGQDLPLPDGEDVSLPEGEEIPLADGEDVPLPDDEEIPLADGEDVPLPDEEEIPLADGEDVPLPEEEEIPLADGEDVPLPDDQDVPRSDSEVREIGSPAPEITVDGIEAARPKGQDALIPDVPEIGSPAPQIAIEPTDDQIEEARLNHDVMSFDIGSPAPEITIEPMAEDDGEEIQFEPANEVTVQIEGNGHAEQGGFLNAQPRPRLDIPRAGTPLNSEYRIEVMSPGSAQHDSDDEMWVTQGINGTSLQAAGGGLNALD